MMAFVDPMLPRMSCQQLRMVVAQAAQLVAEAEGGRSARLLLDDVKASIPGTTPMREIVTAVAARHGLTEADLLGRSKRRWIVRPRQEAYFLIYQQGRQSLPQIGQYFGGRDHTTVLAGMRRHKKHLADHIDQTEAGAHGED